MGNSVERNVLSDFACKKMTNFKQSKTYAKFKPNFRKIAQKLAIILSLICKVLSRETQAELALQGDRKDI